MIVCELLDRMTLDCETNVVLTEFFAEGGTSEHKLPKKERGISFVSDGYKEFAHREVYAVHVIGNTIHISLMY